MFHPEVEAYHTFMGTEHLPNSGKAHVSNFAIIGHLDLATGRATYHEPVYPVFYEEPELNKDLQADLEML